MKKVKKSKKKVYDLDTRHKKGGKMAQKKKRGRPAIYTPELADKVCALIATKPVGLQTICDEDPSLPSRDTIFLWKWTVPGFCDKYAEAKRQQADCMADATLTLAHHRPFQSKPDGTHFIDSGEAMLQRCEIDTLKWHAAKLLPKLYGKGADEIKIDASESLVEKLLKSANVVEVEKEQK